MLEWKTINSMPIVKFCKGTIVAARVYADVKGGKCSCGGSFSKRVPHSDEKFLLMPVCEQCDSRPATYVIDVDAKDDMGENKPFRIRNTKDSERLDSPTKVAYIINVIQRELLDGSFNIAHYASSKSKEAFIFKNYIEREYLPMYQRRLERGEVSPKGLTMKKGLIERELLPFFGHMELFRIKDAMIEKFKESYTTKLRTRDLAIGELKVILNQAQRDDLIKFAPKFPPIARAKKRDEVISLELAQKTISVMPKQIYRDFYSLLLIYPLRPGELRALKWSEVDFKKNEFTISWHFSGLERIKGRKSVKEGKEASISFPINEEAREIFLRQKGNILSFNGDDFVFKSRFNRHLSEDTVWEAWNRARKKINHSFAPYECRHASASELYRKTGGDLIRMKKVGGWTNTSTLERYVTDRSDNQSLF